MQFDTPIPFTEAIAKLASRGVVPSSLSSAEWGELAVALRENAFFSSRVESARVLQRMRDDIQDWLLADRAIESHGGLRHTGRAQFVADMRELAIREGLGVVDPETGKINPNIRESDLTDIRSVSRLQLIFDTQTESAQEYGYFQQGQDSAILDVFPAQRFIRVRPVNAPRPYHEAALGEIRRKDDLQFWISLNRDFGVPWGPWGFGSGCGVEDVDRDEAIAAGVMKESDTVKPTAKDFNDKLSASIKDLSPDFLTRLLKITGGSVADGRLMARRAPAADLSEPGTLAAKVSAAASSREAHSMLEISPADRGTMLLSTSVPVEIRAVAMRGKAFLESMVHSGLLPTASIKIHHDTRPKARGRYLNSTRRAEVIKSTSNVIHELAHAVEYDHPQIYQKCLAFRKSRTQGESLQKIADITGEKSYLSNESGYADEWAKRGGTGYEGKHYGKHHQATEILTCGLERLYSDPRSFAAQDPDYFNFILQTIRNL